MRRLLATIILALGLAPLAGAAAKPVHSYYDSPYITTTTQSCEMAIVKGPFYIHKDTSSTANPYVVLSSTHGVYSRYGITCTTMSLTGVSSDPSAPTGAIAYRSDLDQIRLKTSTGWVSITTGTTDGFVSTSTALTVLSSTQTKTGGLNVIGYVGIGTASPAFPLDVNGVLRANNGVQVGTSTRKALVTIDQPAGTATPMLAVSTGTTKLFEVNGSSVGLGAPLFFPDGTSINTAPSASVAIRSQIYISSFGALGQAFNGTSNTKIVNMSSATTNGPFISSGTGILWSANAAAGSSFTIATAGLYNISYSVAESANEQWGISLNSTELSTNIQSIAAGNRFCTAFAAGSGGDNVASTSCTLFLPVGSVIRLHGQGPAPAGSTGRMNYFNIIQIAN